jgi:hypothetical protein
MTRMYVVVRRYTGADKLVEVMIPRQSEVRDLISGVPGFKAYYAVNTGGGGVVTITVCDTQAGTTESSRRAGEWVRANVTGVTIGPPEIAEGEAYIAF